jgi:leucyl-tRNA synthetase
VRSRLSVPAAATDAAIKDLALADPAIAKWLQGQPPKKVILARRKLVNIVI